MTEEHAVQESDGDPAPPVRVKTHPALCQGWGECHRWAPQIYPLNEDGHIAVHVVDIPSEDADDAWWGATACPELAITLIGPPEQYWFDRLRHRLDRNRQDR
jgi:ferredoxin